MADLNQYLENKQDWPSEYQHIPIASNKAKRKAWNRTDERLTRLHSGLYFVRVGDKLMMIDRRENLNGGNWVWHEVNHPEHVCEV